MLNSDFENKVRQQMEELTLSPGELVWDQIERNLPREEKRRPWLLYALFFVLLLGGLFFMWNTTGEKRKEISAGKTANKSSIGNDHTQVGKSKSATSGDGATATEALNRTVTPGTSFPSENSDKATGTNPDTDVTPGHTRSFLPFKQQGQATSKVVASMPEIENQNPTVTSHASDHLNNETARSNGETDRLPPLYNVPLLVQSNAYELHFPDSIFNITRVEPGLLTQLLPTGDVVNRNQALPLPTKQKPAKWQYALIAGGGFSSVVSGLFNNKNVLADNMGNSSGGVSGPGTGSGMVVPPNEPSPSAAFTAGLQVERSMGKRWKLITGLNYVYLSSVVKTGSLVDSSATFNVGNGSITAGNFYQQGNAERYKNGSHLLHLPLLFQYALVQTAPVYIEAGPGISYLVGSNVLLYNSSGRAYFSNTDAYNKLLFSFTAGAGVELNRHKQIPFRLDYRFNYGINSVTKASFGRQQLQSSMLYLTIPLK